MQKAAGVRSSPARARKSRLLEGYVKALEQYRYFLVATITGLPASVIKASKSLLLGDGSLLKVVKNTIFLIALEKAGKNAKEAEQYLKGQNAVIFTNKNPFSIIFFLDKQKIMREARAGDIATSEIVLPAGNTGIPPGPMISNFNKLGIPTRVQEGSIWIAKDTVVARPGDVISPELAEVLTRLGLKPIESKLQIKAIYLDGKIVAPKDVELDVKLWVDRLASAHAQACSLAFNAALPIPQTLPALISRAHAEALALASQAGYPTKEVLPTVLGRAEAQAKALYEKLKTIYPEL
ncbi:MAG: 50S ribosomal protein L10 [Thermofilum sp.]|jgi:large subunit ribosomal protein L10|nr:50S ribosomal protein L10 [Thermofilum sp.]